MVATLATAALTACGFHHNKSQIGFSGKSDFLDVNGRIYVPSDKAPGYETVKALVFQSRCLECHGRAGGVNLNSYESAKRAMKRIQFAVLDDQSMPPDEPLTFEEQQLIRAWITAGAPEKDVSSAASVPAATPTPTPVVSPTPAATPLPIPVVVRFADVNAGVFAPKCIRCHNDHRSAGDVNLDGYENVMRNLNEIKEEALDSLDMPPRKPLADDEQKLLRTWIDQGAIADVTAMPKGAQK